MSVQVNCPGCGGPIVFSIGSAIVAVCPYCRSVVARGDRKVEDLGKVAALAETESPLRLGLRGRYVGVPFELVGRAQIGHAAGGVWDEWYAHFSDDRWGWLAEAQGRFYFTFETPLKRARPIPPLDQLALGAVVPLGPGGSGLVVAEKGTGTARGAEGQIPYRLVPNQTYTYADLSGPQGEFATLDYGDDPPSFFLGREIEIEALGIPDTDLRRPRDARQGSGVQLSCPHCGGPLALRAPDRTERVTCPNCGSLLDVKEGQLSFFKALEPGRIKPAIPIGTTGEIEGSPFILIGFMQRSVKVEGVRYPWEEYLLYHRQHGFRWLVRSSDHWSAARPLPAGQVHASGRIAHYGGRDFKLFQAGKARVDYVIGEFYWRVEVGERTGTADYIRPPEMLSQEVSQGEGSTEINWSLGSYFSADDVEKTFGVKGLPRPLPWNIAPNQPFPHTGIYAAWAILSVITIVLGIALIVAIGSRTAFNQDMQFAAPAAGHASATIFTPEFELKGHRNVQIHLRLNGNPAPTWVGVDGDVVNAASQKPTRFATPVTFGNGASVSLSALPAGTYRLRLSDSPYNWSKSVSMHVTVQQGSPGGTYLFLALLALAVIPVGTLIYQFWFEQQRWKQSDFGSSGD